MDCNWAAPMDCKWVAPMDCKWVANLYCKRAAKVYRKRAAKVYCKRADMLGCKWAAAIDCNQDWNQANNCWIVVVVRNRQPRVVKNCTHWICKLLVVVAIVLQDTMDIRLVRVDCIVHCTEDCIEENTAHCIVEQDRLIVGIVVALVMEQSQ